MTLAASRKTLCPSGGRGAIHAPPGGPTVEQGACCPVLTVAPLKG
jgi:hypothetical protein